MSTTFTPEQVNKARETAKKIFDADGLREIEQAIADATPFGPDIKKNVPASGNLHDIMVALDAGTFDMASVPKAATVSSGASKALTTYNLVNPAAGTITARVKEFREGSKVPVLPGGSEIPEGDIANALPNEISSLALEGRSMILGVTPVSLLAEFIAVISAAREAGDPVPLIMAGVFAVTEGYTVASAWADRYSQLPKPHPFTKFEVEGRSPIKTAAGATVAAWVSSSKMNSSAVHILGHMIVNAAPDDSFLKTVKEQAGTIFSPPPRE